MILALELAFASIAIVLTILSLRTLGGIRHLGVGKSFWIPVFVSSIFFFVASAVTIFHDMNFLMMARIDEVVHVSRLLALSILVCGIYSYSRRVKDSLSKRLSVPEEADVSQKESPIEEGLEIEVPIKESPKTVTTLECKHQLGYLRTLPRQAGIPDECLSCGKIIKCKHSAVNTIEIEASD